MPIYEYVCQSCQASFELLVRGSEEPTCPQCHSTQLEKQFSVPAAHTAGGQSHDLPVCNPGGSCGLPQCGGGMCGLE